MEPVDEHNLALVREQIVAEETRLFQAISQRMTQRQLSVDAADLDRFRQQRLETQIAEMIPFALEVWEEGDRCLPLTEDQLASVSMRHSHARAVNLTRMMEARLSEVSSTGRPWAAAMVQAFKKGNERMAPFRNVSDVGENDLERIAREMANDIDTVTKQLRRDNNLEDKET